MAKKAMIEREKKRARLVNRYAAKRAELKEIAKDESLPMEERFKAVSYTHLTLPTSVTV